MELLINTVVNYIKNDLAKDANKEGIWRYVLPSYPPKALLKIGEKLSEFLTVEYGAAARLEYGVAYGLGLKWKNDPKTSLILADIKAKGWYNEGNNLTELRNKPKPAGISKMVIGMAGKEEIDDRDSLKDFVSLDNENIWKLAMKTSFTSWLQNLISPAINIDKLDAVFTWIYENYYQDLYGISCFLEKCDFNSCVQADDVYEKLAEGLSREWHMPMLLGALRRGNNPQTFRYYAQEGIKFFRYEPYKKPSERNKILSQIKRIQSDDEITIPEPEVWEKGCYNDIHDILEDLEKYIENNDPDAAGRLSTVDFAYLHDKILQKRIKSDPKPKKDSEKRLRGLPPEVFLRALLLTISEFMNKNYPKYGVLPDGLKITIKSKSFRHNFYEGADDEDSTGTNAHKFLTRVLGGIDNYLQKQMEAIFDRASEIKLEYKPNENEFSLDDKKTYKIPYLEFLVRVELNDKYLEKKYGWEIPDNHPSLLLHELTEWLIREYSSKNEPILPLVGIPFINELFMAKGQESVIRILRQGLSKSIKVKNLAQISSIPSLFHGLAYHYYQFWKMVDNNGLFAAFQAQFDGLRKEYEDVTRLCLEEKKHGSQDYLILMKAFLITDINTVNTSDIEWENKLEASVITVLHPALLELLFNQYTYLARAFNYIVKYKDDLRSWLKDWSRIVDLGGIKRPLFGMIGEGSRLKTDIESYEYVHLLGTVGGLPDFIDSKLLLEYDNDDDDELAEADLFERSQTSLLVKDLLNRYLDNHPYAWDGMCITVYCGSRIQSIIAGLDEFLKELLKDRTDEYPFSLQLTLLSDAESDNEVMNWVNAWKDIWYQEESGGTRSYYAKCEITLRFRVVSRERTAEELNDFLNENPSDIVILCDIVDDADSEIRLADLTDFDDYIRFPILEKVVCSTEYYKSKRQRIVSNQRFSLPLRHAEMVWLAHTGMNELPPGKTCMVFASSSIKRLSKAVTAAHGSANWVICLDEDIDKALLLDIAADHQGDGLAENRIEIVGFGTGVGSHGELNYTVSTTKYQKSTIKEKLAVDIERILGDLGINKEQKMKLTDVLVKAADEITGMSLVKVTGIERFVREFIGSAMVRRMLNQDDQAFCDELVCLDDFPHWFNFDTNDHRRPDLLRLKANIKDGYVNIDAQVIECKVGQENEEHIEKARKQINNGLKHLISLFVPRTNEQSAGLNINIPPDRRYWWMQLHRVIASKSRIGIGQSPEHFINALERLSEGYFNIRWQAAAFVFLTDIQGEMPIIDSNSEEWRFNFEMPELSKRDLQTSLIKVPRDFIPAHCLGAQETAFSDPFNEADYVEIKCIRNEKDEEGGEGSSSDYSKECGVDDAQSIPNAVQHQDTINFADWIIDGKKDNEVAREPTPVVTVTSRYPERVFLGIQPNTNKKIYWEYGHKDLPNRHLLVFGASGQGKTYAIQAILWELAKGGQNSIIIDYTDGFTNKQLDPITKESLKPKQLYVKMEPLPINIFRRQLYFLDELEITDKPAEVAQRVSGVFSAVYNLGEQQKGTLYDAIKNGVETKGTDFTLDDLVSRLEKIRDKGGPLSTPAGTIVNKIKPFVDTQPFGPEDPESWEKIYSDGTYRCHIIQLTGFNSKEITRLITEFALLDFYRYYRLHGNTAKPRVIVLDEAQNLDHSLESPIGQMLTEGRKFGISLILATQTLSNLSKDEKDRLFQAKHKLFFRPADTELGTFAKIIADSLNRETDEWVRNLAGLKKGECYSVGPALDEATGNLIENACFKIRVTSLENREAGI